MTDAAHAGERTARRSPRRSPLRGVGATAPYCRCCMMLHSDHISRAASRSTQHRSVNARGIRLAMGPMAAWVPQHGAPRRDTDMHAGKRAN